MAGRSCHQLDSIEIQLENPMLPRSRAKVRLHHGDNNEWLASASAIQQDGWRTPTIEDSEHPAHRTKNLTSGDSLLSLKDTLDGHQDREDETRDQPDIQETTMASDEKPMHLSWKQRIKHATWAWFTLTMATGGISNVLYSGDYGKLHVFK